jgi:hypothetical protein
MPDHAGDGGFDCGGCGERHPGLPLAYGTDAPAYWDERWARDPDSVLDQEVCVVGGEHYFLRGRIVLPVLDTGEEFEWGVWVSLSETSFARVAELWDDPARVDAPPYFGWLSTELPLYQPSTLNLKTMVHSQPVGVRPTIEVEPTDHPLAVEQRTGITRARVQQIAERLLHPEA